LSHVDEGIASNLKFKIQSPHRMIEKAAKYDLAEALHFLNCGHEISIAGD
jgi:hypothetical protein